MLIGTENTYWKGQTMQLRAIKRYVDKYTKEMILEGTIIEADETRAQELIGNGACVSYRPSSGGRKRTGRNTATAAGDSTSTGLTETKNTGRTCDDLGEGV